MDIEKLSSLRTQPVPPAMHVINGARCAASDGAVMEVISPIDGSVLTTMPRGTSEDGGKSRA